MIGVHSPHNHIEEVLAVALEEALEKKAPERKRARRLKRQARKKAKENESPRPEEERQGNGRSGCAGGEPGTRRDVPSELRESALARAGYRCEFVGPEGKRCGCRTGLEIEHTWRKATEEGAFQGA